MNPLLDWNSNIYWPLNLFGKNIAYEWVIIIIAYQTKCFMSSATFVASYAVLTHERQASFGTLLKWGSMAGIDGSTYSLHSKLRA